MAATTTLLGLVTPTQGTLSGTWGDTVNYGISDYVDISIAGTLSFAGDGAITLTNTTGSASGNNIGSTTAQYMVIRITGTQTVTKVITGPSYSKLYMVDHAGATSAVTFKAAGQTGVSVAVGEKVFVYYNGSDYVKVAPYFVGGVLPVANGGTGVSTSTGSGNVVLSTSPTLVTPVLGTPSSGTLSGCTVDGTYSVGFRKIPPVGVKTTSYTLGVGDAGKYVQVGTSGAIVVPASIFSDGDAITIFNNTSGNITMTTSAVNAYLAGTNSLKTSVTIATRGVSNILFYSASDCVITGNVS